MENLDLEKMEIDELKLEAQQRGIKVHHKVKDKQKVIDMINNSISVEQPKVEQPKVEEIKVEEIKVEEIKVEEIKEPEVKEVVKEKTEREILNDFDEKIMNLHKQINDLKSEREIFYQKMQKKVEKPSLQKLLEISRGEGIGNKHQEIKKKKEMMLKQKRRQENANILNQVD